MICPPGEVDIDKQTKEYNDYNSYAENYVCLQESPMRFYQEEAKLDTTKIFLFLCMYAIITM